MEQYEPLNDFLKPLNGALDELMESYGSSSRMPTPDFVDDPDMECLLTECNCNCGTMLDPRDAIWGPDNQPYVSESHMNTHLMKLRTKRVGKKSDRR